MDINFRASDVRNVSTADNSRASEGWRVKLDDRCIESIFKPVRRSSICCIYPGRSIIAAIASPEARFLIVSSRVPARGRVKSRYNTGRHLCTEDFITPSLAPERATSTNRINVTRSRYVSLLGVGFKKLLKPERRHRHVAHRFVSCSRVLVIEPYTKRTYGRSVRPYSTAYYDFRPDTCDSNGGE